MIQCTARTRHGDLQCDKERGHDGPHSIDRSIDVPPAMAPFFADLWADLQEGKRTLEKQIRRQRVLNVISLAAICVYLGLTLGNLFN